jgi:ABC-type polysaccharide/polyol phosphate transport system ATPase subunit
MPDNAAVRLQSVSKRYRIYQQRHQTLKEAVLKLGRGRWEDLWALRDITADIPRGQTLGVIGENGSGKSTLLKLLAGIVHPDSGQVQVQGRISALLELGTTFEMEYTGRENIFLYGTMLGLRRREVAQRYEAIVRFAEMERFIDNPVKNYSSGMYMRLAFAIAVQVDPDVLLVDEVLAVGDEAFQRKCFARMAEFRGGDRTIVLVSHDLDAVRRFCDRVLWIDRGRLAADTDPERATSQYLETSSQRIAAGDFEINRGPVVAEIGEMTSQVRIASVRLIDRGGRVRSLFDEGEPMTLEVAFRSHIASADVAFVVSVFRSDGLPCTEFSTSADGLPCEVVPGNGTTLVDIPSLPFREGTYEISVGVFDSLTKTTHDYQHRQTRFQVRGQGGQAWLVAVPHRWQFQGAGREVRDEHPAVGT